MSEEFEVRALYEDRLDEAVERAPRGMAGQLAVMTALLATVGAVFSYMAGATQADAAREKTMPPSKRSRHSTSGISIRPAATSSI